MQTLTRTTLVLILYNNFLLTSAGENSKLFPQNRIVNGREGDIEQFPYQLSLRRNSVHICGASILSSSWAITAAHCIDGFDKNPKVLSLRMGSKNRSTGGSVIAITTIYKHPSYNSDTMNFDVALLRTHANAMEGNSISPINLPVVGANIPIDLEATVSGWGHSSSTNSVLSSVLQYTTVYVVRQSDCFRDMKDHGEITDAMFCAAARRTDACQGDSGGPLQVNGQTLIGVVSWGVGCADPKYPGVYTRLSYPPIRQWIRLLTRL